MKIVVMMDMYETESISYFPATVGQLMIFPLLVDGFGILLGGENYREMLIYLFLINNEIK